MSINKRGIEVIRYPTALRGERIVTIGNFDGVHLGHQKILFTLLKKAEKLRPTVISFYPHPRGFFKKEKVLNINTFKHKIKLLSSFGIYSIYLIRFDSKIASLSYQKFIDDILIQKIQAKSLILGSDAAFGRGREGDIDAIRDFIKKRDLLLYVDQLLLLNNDKIGSQLLRNSIQQGDLRRIRELLGREYSIYAKVVRGDGRGRQLGFPTINFNLKNIVLLPLGVYATETQIGNIKKKSVTNIGTRPTFNGNKTVVETYILGFNGDLYGKDVEVIFKSKIRDEIKFNSALELKTQIIKDIEERRFIK